MAQAATLKPSKPRSTTDAPSSEPTRAFAMLSNQGRRRHSNQDACAALPERGAFVVCDGMGGAAAGEVASLLACEAFLDCLVQRCCPPAEPTEPDLAHSPPIAAEPVASKHNATQRSSNGPHAETSKSARSRLAQAIRAANQAVFRHSRKSPSLHGMGTTLVALLMDDSTRRPQDDAPTQTIWIAHVGDSRCYLFRAGVLYRLTQDHSLVEEQVRAGLLSHVQAVASPIRNIITRAVGSRPTVEPEIASHTTQPGDLYMLASDGLTRELDDSEITAILNQATSPATLAPTTPSHTLQAALDTACQALVDAANANGGRDNITVLLVPCP